ncbi:hypothetical protein GCM10023156_00340 [Novipirellula rosea]|uniref:RNA polymerase sigma factor n=2 Tax=Novipirellula rosea TaxID=1031540 RepID=A0ABP8M2H3_9BACT
MQRDSAGQGLAFMTTTKTTSAVDVINDNFTRGIILKKARQIVTRPGLGKQDIPTIEQALLAHVIEAMKSFDPAIGHRKSFTTTIVERYTKSILRGLRRHQTNSGGVMSLNIEVIVQDEPPTQLQNTLSESVGRQRLQIDRRADIELADLASDMAAMIATLPEDWQRMLELRKEHSLVRVSELMGIPRRTIRDWMKQVAERFEEAGLRDYLG